MEKDEQKSGRESDNQKEKFVIKIPSYQEVIDSSQPKTTSSSLSSSSLFNPSPSFSQAFNFIKNSDFYSAPPPPPSYPPSRQTGPSEIPSTSSSQQPVSVSSSSVGASRNAILVSHRQKGNPLLKYIRNVRWAFAEIVSDYQLGQNACAIYLRNYEVLNHHEYALIDRLHFVVAICRAIHVRIQLCLPCNFLRYHLLHPDYLYFRIRELQKNFRLRVVLCYVDVEDVAKPLLEVTKTALLHDCALLCGWSLEECGRYLETIKVYENKPADLIQGQMDTDYLSRLNHALTAIRHVNKTDVVTLGSTFGSLMHIIDAPMEDLARCPGIGEQKVRRLYDTFHEPFKRVIPTCQPVPETPINNNVESTSKSEKEDVEEENVVASKRRKKEPELTIKSALTAAFAKYSDRVGRNKNKVQEGEEKDKSVANKKGSTKQKKNGKEATTSASN